MSHFCDYDGDRACDGTTCREETGSRGSKIVLPCLSPVSGLWRRVCRSYTSTSRRGSSLVSQSGSGTGDGSIRQNHARANRPSVGAL